MTNIPNIETYLRLFFHFKLKGCQSNIANDEDVALMNEGNLYNLDFVYNNH